MKRKFGICFFVACLFAVIGINSTALRKAKETDPGTVMDVNEDSEADLETDLEVNSIVNQNQISDDKYVIYSEDGILVVYYADRTTVFFNSGVRADALPADLQEQLSFGLSFTNEAELYEFLENYSS
jgi:hypothetical protein